MFFHFYHEYLYFKVCFMGSPSPLGNGELTEYELTENELTEYKLTEYKLTECKTDRM